MFSSQCNSVQSQYSTIGQRFSQYSTNGSLTLLKILQKIGNGRILISRSEKCSNSSHINSGIIQNLRMIASEQVASVLRVSFILSLTFVGLFGVAREPTNHKSFGMTDEL